MRIIVMLVAIIAASTACNRSPTQKDFASPEDASQALLVAAKADNTRALLEVLGAAAEPGLNWCRDRESAIEAFMKWIPDRLADEGVQINERLTRAAHQY